MPSGRLSRLLGRFPTVWERTRGRALPMRVLFLLQRGFMASWALLATPLSPVTYPLGQLLLATPLNALLSRSRRKKFAPGSVLHISKMVHIPFYTTRILRRVGVHADYLAVDSPTPAWSQCDFHYDPDPRSIVRELFFFWRVVARYEIIHCHFALGLTHSGWEFPVLKRMGRKIVVHYRGCEVREEKRNRELHPALNICQECDYGGRLCREGKPRVDRIRPHGDLFLATTPDLRDFAPDAIHFPFFSPEPEELPEMDSGRRASEPGTLRIVHVTNQPGIEGSVRIEAAIASLKKKGHAIEFRFLRGVKPDEVIAALRDADLSIGKMKMGYYANTQIESLAMGVPAVTWIRPEFMTPALEQSALIITHLDDLEKTLEHYLTHPEELLRKREMARSSARVLHDNAQLATELSRLYGNLKSN